jgi:hypothetical protein
VIGVEIGPWGRIGSKRSIGDVGDTDRARATRDRTGPRGRSAPASGPGGGRVRRKFVSIAVFCSTPLTRV